jgi:hypothetical protein
MYDLDLYFQQNGLQESYYEKEINLTQQRIERIMV